MRLDRLSGTIRIEVPLSQMERTSFTMTSMTGPVEYLRVRLGDQELVARMGDFGHVTWVHDTPMMELTLHLEDRDHRFDGVQLLFDLGVAVSDGG